MVRRRRTLAAAIVALGLLAIVLFLELGSDPSPPPAVRYKAVAEPSSTTTTPTALPSPPYAVSDETLTFVDPSRPTPPRGDVAGSATRTLETEIFKPVGLTGPLPLIVFGHGWNSNPGVYEQLLDEWAQAGYLVAAPVFPDSSNLLPGTPISDYGEQAEDLSFVITAMLKGPAGPVDPQKIVVAGHSDGGTDVALMALNPTFRDPRVAAYLSLSSEIPDGMAGPWGAASDVPLFVAVGTEDEYGLLPRSTQVFDVADQPKVLVVAQGGDHLGSYLGPSSEEVAMRNETLRFLSAALRSPTPTSASLGAALAPTGDPSLVVTSGAP